MSMKHCPHCDLEMEHQESEPEVGFIGGWYCDYCSETFSDDDDYADHPDF